MTDTDEELSAAYVAALQRLGGAATLDRVCEVIDSVTDLQPTERGLRPLMEHLISDRKLEFLGKDKAGLPLNNIHSEFKTYTEALEWARGWLNGTIPK